MCRFGVEKALAAALALGMQTHYTYRLEWSTDTYEYYARCLEINGLYAVAPTAREALARAEAAVDAYLRESEEVFGSERRSRCPNGSSAAASWCVRRPRCMRDCPWKQLSKRFRSINGWCRSLPAGSRAWTGRAQGRGIGRCSVTSRVISAIS